MYNDLNAKRGYVENVANLAIHAVMLNGKLVPHA